jgi:hypothetical protein
MTFQNYSSNGAGGGGPSANPLKIISQVTDESLGMDSSGFQFKRIKPTESNHHFDITKPVVINPEFEELHDLKDCNVIYTKKEGRKVFG